MHVGKLSQPKPKSNPNNKKRTQVGSFNPTHYSFLPESQVKLSLVPVLISEKDSVNLNELQGHVNNWREIICDFAKEGFHAVTQKYRHLAETTKSAI